MVLTSLERVEVVGHHDGSRDQKTLSRRRQQRSLIKDPHPPSCATPLLPLSGIPPHTLTKGNLGGLPGQDPATFF
jgi:hypothetical protein